jgi:hypothetical protein
MALSISPSFRLKATAGQAAPINEVGAHEVLAGGTFALVDRGAGDVAWQFSGTGDTSALIGSAYTMDQTTGATLAVTLRIATAPTVDFTRYVIYATSNGTSGLVLSQNGAGAIRSRAIDDSSNGVTGAIGAVGSVDVTYVVRFGANFDTWATTAGRSGTAPNVSTSSGTVTTTTLVNMIIRAAASDVIQVKDIAFFKGKLTDTECAALADSFRATADAANPNATASGATLTGVSTIAAGAASGTAAGTGPGATLTGISTISAGAATGGTGSATATGATLTGVSSMVPGAASALPTLTTRKFRNNTGTALANQANCALNIYNSATGALVLRVTGLTTTAAGRLVVSNAALTAGATYAYELDLTAASLGRRLPTIAAA